MSLLHETGGSYDESANTRAKTLFMYVLICWRYVGELAKNILMTCGKNIENSINCLKYIISSS